MNPPPFENVPKQGGRHRMPCYRRASSPQEHKGHTIDDPQSGSSDPPEPVKSASGCSTAGWTSDLRRVELGGQPDGRLSATR